MSNRLPIDDEHVEIHRYPGNLKVIKNDIDQLEKFTKKQLDVFTKKLNQWISLKDKLPLNDQWVDVWIDTGHMPRRICDVKFINGEFVNPQNNEKYSNVSYWMESPIPPYE